MKTAAIYARVSTADQVKGTSLDGQVELCQTFAKEQGLTVIKIVREDASGARLDRKGLGEIRDMAWAGELEAVIVFDPDRLSRSMAHMMLLVDELERYKAGILFVNAPREDTPEGKMLFGIRSLFAEYEREKIRERTRRGKQRRIEEGSVFMSRSSPYGYRYIVGESRIEIIEEEAVWVRRIYEWAALEGLSLRKIGRRLDEMGVPTKQGGHGWYSNVVASILGNEVYAGIWHYGKRASCEPRNPYKGTRKHVKSSRERRPREEWLSAPVPAIVDRALYDAIQPQLARNKALSTRNSKYPYLLRGMIVCAKCGYKMFGLCRSVGQPKQHLSYACTGRNLKHRFLPIEERCQQPSVTAADLEALVWGEVVRQVSDQKLLADTLAERAAQKDSALRKDELELEALYTREAALAREADKVLDLHLRDIIDVATLQTHMASIRQQQSGLAPAKAEIQARMASRELSGGSLEAIQRLTEAALAGLADCTFEERREFLDAMGVMVYLDGANATITGLITDRTLSLTLRYSKPYTRRNTRQDAELAGVLCNDCQ